MRILTKILIFDENIDFFAEFWVLTEMLIFAENTPIYEYTPSPRIKGRATTFVETLATIKNLANP